MLLLELNNSSFSLLYKLNLCISILTINITGVFDGSERQLKSVVDLLRLKSLMLVGELISHIRISSEFNKKLAIQKGLLKGIKIH